jgi:hypothetical protein
MVLWVKLDSELKTSGLRGPAKRSPARPPIFSAHPCARWHRSGRRFKYLYCVHTCVTAGGRLTTSVPGAPADVEGDPRLSPTETVGQICGSRLFALNSTSGLSALSGDGLRESHPFLSGHIDGCYRAQAQGSPFSSSSVALFTRPRRFLTCPAGRSALRGR